MKMILYICLVCVYSCRPESNSTTLRANDSFVTIVEFWEGQSINYFSEQPDGLKKYTPKYIDSIKYELGECVLFQYDRSERIQKRRTFYKEVDCFLQDFIVNQFYAKVSVENLTSEKIEFMQDTFRMNETCRMILAIDPSYSPVLYSHELYKHMAQECLIYKYYVNLLKILSPADREKLIISQKKWNESLWADCKLAELVSYYYDNRDTLDSYHMSKEYEDRFLFLFYTYILWIELNRQTEIFSS